MKALERTASAASLGAAVVIGSGLPILPARAAYVVTLQQEGSNVVATGTGTIDLTGLTMVESSFPGGPGIVPSEGVIVTGPASGANEDLYTGFTGPTSFGSGGALPPSSGNGNIVGIAGSSDALFDVPVLVVPAGYPTSGSALSDTMTFDNTTLAGLGVTPGTYTWMWGAVPTTADDDTFTLDAVAATVVPEPSTWVMMLAGFAGLAFAGWRARGGFPLAA
jgi:hypothetical protein